MSSIRGLPGKKRASIIAFHNEKCKIKERVSSIFSAKGQEECMTFIQWGAMTSPACLLATDNRHGNVIG